MESSLERPGGLEAAQACALARSRALPSVVKDISLVKPIVFNDCARSRPQGLGARAPPRCDPSACDLPGPVRALNSSDQAL